MFHYRQGLNDQRRVKPMEILNFLPGEPWGVVCDQRRKNWISLNLHWDSVATRRVPCVGPECECRGKGVGWALEERVYVPVQACRLNTTGSEFVFPSYFMWCTYLVGFTEGILDVLYEEGGKGCWCIRRARGKKNARLIATPMDTPKEVGEFAFSYPVLETLQRVFGAKTDPKG